MYIYFTIIIPTCKNKFLDNATHITFSCCFRKRIEAVYANFETEILNFYDGPYFR